MRAFAVRAFGESPGICDLPIPAAEDSVLVRLSYAGVNPVDVQLADQLTTSAFPFGVTAGQRLVVMGAAGGVGGYAVQMALARGAHVIATVRGDVEEAQRLGAQEVYDADAADIVGALWESHPDGVDAVLDVVSDRSVIGATPSSSSPGAG